MYLSKVDLAPNWGRNPYQWHRALWQLFPERPDGTRDFLFRTELAPASSRLQVLLQSSSPPARGADGVHVRASKEFEPALHGGQRLRFHLTANPIKTIRDSGGRQNRRGEPKACRVPLVQVEQQEAWLRRKLEDAAELQAVEIANAAPLYFRRQGEAGKVVPVRFDGVLIVQEPDRFLELLRRGVGPAKSFGCGLLSLARV